DVGEQYLKELYQPCRDALRLRMMSTSEFPLVSLVLRRTTKVADDQLRIGKGEFARLLIAVRIFGDRLSNQRGRGHLTEWAALAIAAENVWGPIRTKRRPFLCMSAKRPQGTTKRRKH